MLFCFLYCDSFNPFFGLSIGPNFMCLLKLSSSSNEYIFESKSVIEGLDGTERVLFSGIFILVPSGLNSSTTKLPNLYCFYRDYTLHKGNLRIFDGIKLMVIVKLYDEKDYIILLNFTSENKIFGYKLFVRLKLLFYQLFPRLQKYNNFSPNFKIPDSKNRIVVLLKEWKINGDLITKAFFITILLTNL
ncbi:hypothetical protein BpHYR1_009953 [Brachionus plicatilis]|uniref:Uncharacterized protein n=1 Tax=Brachionus plicatilis TaxID=10195 RepID=A0A3M7QIF6_BRAPC|nr:hypothetical protein BpHYR1_009953 [Brachionus plicatilis]